MPAGSKTDLQLAKAEPNSDGGSVSGITELRRGEKKNKTKNTHQEELQPERGARTCERNNSADTKVSEEGGGGGAPVPGAEIPLQPLEKTMVRQAVPQQPMEVNSGADIHLQPTEDPMTEQVDAPKGGCDPMGSPCWSRLLAGPVAPWREEPRLEQVCWQDL
ncbi:AN1-type zinc finger protein 5-like [Grus japonensis]|uniref:AN1-type zinc finger protein 5-like n=1 Tax=Grus japonensis TaxID=30415 RepID=A0ABC9WK32_GRUJA